MSNYIRSTYFNDPPNVKSHAAFLKQYPFDKIWSFNDEDDVYNIVNIVISELNKRSRIAEGVSNSTVIDEQIHYIFSGNFVTSMSTNNVLLVE